MYLSIYLQTFDSFSIDPMDKFLNVLKNDEWKNVRSIVTTTFTTAKLKKVKYKVIFTYIYFFEAILI